jgi:FtsZ-binding cell division protein ZapB
MTDTKPEGDRLAEIKTKLDEGSPDWPNYDEIQLLIAEIERLEAAHNEVVSGYNGACEDNERLRAENERLLKAVDHWQAAAIQRIIDAMQNE